MSNTRSSGPAIKADSDHQRAICNMVEKRQGRQWCLFLDRDGVLNRQIVGDYVRSWNDFVWLPKAKLALKELRAWAPYIVVVTNQQGVGKGLMTIGDLEAIHRRLQAELAAEGVGIDAFQICPHLESAHCACRKPNPGLVLDWLGQHPSCDPRLSIMAGDSQGDLNLAHNVATTVGSCASIEIGGRGDPDAIADASFDSLFDLSVAVGCARGK